MTDLNGSISAAYINAVSEPQGLTFTGTISVPHLDVAGNWRWFTHVDGKVTWPGGKIISRSPMGTQLLDLPPLEGDLALNGENVVLTVHHLTSPVLDIVVKPSGWIAVAVKARLFDLAKVAWPAGTGLDDTVLEFEEKVF